MPMSEKGSRTPSTKESSLPQPVNVAPSSKPLSRRRALYALLLAIPCFLFVYGSRKINLPIGHLRSQKFDKAELCPQVGTVYPEKNAELYNEMSNVIGTEAFKDKAIDWLAGAVRVPTESFDGMGPVGVDPRWVPMGAFHDYLLGAFPQVHATLSLQKVNTYGLLFEWTGSDPSLKPLLLAAHQDVVPVHPNTVDEWTHPPYSGYFDGTRIWGRGSSDDKSGLIGIMTTLETLIEKGFKPTRSIVLSFGFDEEISGTHGAAHLATAMLERYGENSFAFVVDEGGGFSDIYGTAFATPGTAEKGYMDLMIEVAAPGGHSSVPPAHTSIGMLSALLVEIEKNPYPLELTREDVLYSSLQCYAAHGASIPRPLKHAIEKAAHSDKGLRKIEKLLFDELAYASLVRTTQAIDLINGGVKTNALPEQAYAVVNHRISTRSSVAETMARDTETLLDVAKSFDLSFTAFGGQLYTPSSPKGSLALSKAFNHSLEPAPRTPTSVGEPGSEPWELLSGTIKATFDSHRADDEEKEDIVVSPGMPTGNTDTKYYWSLSEHIFRYNHKNSFHAVNRLGGVHTVNENIEVDALLEMIRFFTMLVLNTDESSLA